MMYERLIDKNSPPSINFIEVFIGERSHNILMRLETFLDSNYCLLREMKFPLTLQIGDNCVPKLEQILPHLSEKARGLWQNRYPCGSLGGWIHYRVTDVNELNDIFEFIKVKKKPVKQQL
jgi:hypothetical protein